MNMMRRKGRSEHMVRGGRSEHGGRSYIPALN